MGLDNNSSDVAGHPIFEIIKSDRHIRIYANGAVEGCEPVRIVNYLPLVVNRRMV